MRSLSVQQRLEVLRLIVWETLAELTWSLVSVRTVIKVIRDAFETGIRVPARQDTRSGCHWSPKAFFNLERFQRDRHAQRVNSDTLRVFEGRDTPLGASALPRATRAHAAPLANAFVVGFLSLIRRLASLARTRGGKGGGNIDRETRATMIEVAPIFS